MEIILASTNKGKIAEFKKILADLPVTLILQADEDIEPVEETGLTFVENAIIKARHASVHSGLPAFADDSGLCVDALDEAPGVFSARYAGPDATDAERINKLLTELQDVPAEDRTARFHSVIALMSHEGDPAPLICHGIWEGEILFEPRGSKGFGYDPVFFVPTHHCSAAELSAVDKNKISHRGQAMSQFLEVMHEVFADVDLEDLSDD